MGNREWVINWGIDFVLVFFFFYFRVMDPSFVHLFSANGIEFELSALSFKYLAG